MYTRFAMWSPVWRIVVALLVVVSASAFAQTSTDATAKKGPRVQTAESQAALTPASALEKLKKGNARFVEKNMRSRDWLAKVSATAGGQYPFAVILACMDSRAPIELIFDQGIGDVFNENFIANWIDMKQKEYDALRLRPHPYEFAMYYDV